MFVKAVFKYGVIVLVGSVENPVGHTWNLYFFKYVMPLHDSPIYFY